MQLYLPLPIYEAMSWPFGGNFNIQKPHLKTKDVCVESNHHLQTYIQELDINLGSKSLLQNDTL